MPLFFPSHQALDIFTLQLDLHRDDIACGHCGQSQFLISHGHVYQQLHGGKSEPVAKRVLCSNRYSRLGCGHSFRLYVAGRIPHLHYRPCVVACFFCALLAGLTVAAAWRNATGSLCARHAYRWLNRLNRQQAVFRGHAAPVDQSAQPPMRSSTRLTLLLQAIAPVFADLASGSCAVSCYQLGHQSPWF